MIKKPKGTYDVYDLDARKYQFVTSVIDTMCRLYNYKYIKTPIFESSELFHRSVGESSDIVNKETYDFLDRANRNLTLRPEGTAGVVRSYIENKMYGNTALTKLYYVGSMYRYERPQLGRNREFNQFGAELLGSNDYASDVEIISFAYNFLLSIGISNVKLLINSLGDDKSKENYSNALKNYFKNEIDNMCDDCKVRYEKNPLRILDCKVDKDLTIMKEVPVIEDYLSDESKSRFDNILKMLEEFGIDYEIDNSLVRGLDYYSETVFELVVESSELNTSLVVGGGGRYNSLVDALGGPTTNCIGFGLGIDRLVLLLDDVVDEGLDAYIIYSSIEEKEMAMKLLAELRIIGYSADISYTSNNVKNQYKLATNNNSKFYIVVDNENIENNLVKIKNSKTKEEELIELEYVSYYLSQNIEMSMSLDMEEYDEKNIY